MNYKQGMTFAVSGWKTLTRPDKLEVISVKVPGIAVSLLQMRPSLTLSSGRRFREGVYQIVSTCLGSKRLYEIESS